MQLTKNHYRIVVNALRVYVAQLTEEYHEKPSLEKAKIMDEATQMLDLVMSNVNLPPKIKLD